MTCDDSSIKLTNWLSVQVKPNEIFQIGSRSTERRILKVFLPNRKYTVTQRSNAVTERWLPALTKVTGGVLVIGGIYPGIGTVSTVSLYDITTDIWKGIKPQLNIARVNASACTLKGKIYVFCGF